MYIDEKPVCDDGWGSEEAQVVCRSVLWLDLCIDEVLRKKGTSLVIFSTRSRILFSRFKNQDCYRMLGFANGIAEVASTYGIAEPDEKFWRFSLCNHPPKRI